MILSIDPGTTKSGWILVDDYSILDFGIDDNNEVLEIICNAQALYNLDVVIEHVASYGMAVGQTTFDTCVWIGQYYHQSKNPKLVFRKDVKMHLCGQTKGVNDSVIAQRVRDIYTELIKSSYNDFKFGSGSKPTVGTKSSPGPLYGVSGHVWQALALALTYQDGNIKNHKI